MSSVKAKSIPLSSKKLNSSNIVKSRLVKSAPSKKQERLSLEPPRAKSLPLSSKKTRVPTPVKFSVHVENMGKKKLLLQKLPDDLYKRITRTAFLQKEIERKTIVKNVLNNAICKKTTAIRDIINDFELDYFNFNNNEEYKDDDKKVRVVMNEEILLDISSVISGDVELTHMYSYKKLKIDDNRYEIALVKVPINVNDNDDNNNDEYIRKFIPDVTVASLIANAPNLENMIANNHIKDEYNREIIKKLKYKDLINIFNPEIDDYSKVYKKLQSM